MLRTHNCGELNKTALGKKITLAGWVQTIRNKGKLLWLDLRDAYGITQVVLDETTCQAAWRVAKQLGKEYVVGVTGEVGLRQSPNPKMPTGEIEVYPSSLTIYNRSNLPPFLIKDETDGGPALRMRYRYLDLRRPVLQKQLALREKILKLTRAFFSSEQFKEIETPLLIKSTPEGARDFVVPSRLHKGCFYALPQSPQLFKQLLMIGGLDRYFQIAKCFRDEDFRMDRQPEFSQIDCEMSFVTQEDILNLIEKFIQYLLERIKGKKWPTFQRLTYQEALQQYGTDKPDIRFGMPILPLEPFTQQKGCPFLTDCSSVRGIVLPGAATWSRKEIERLGKSWGQQLQTLQGPFWLKKSREGVHTCSLSKFFSESLQAELAAAANCQPGDLLFFIGGDQKEVLTALGHARNQAGSLLKLYKATDIAPLWVVDFPLLAWQEEEQHYTAMHHPFTAYHPEDSLLLEEDPAAVRAQAYDLVINGMELGSGSIRCHDPVAQERVLSQLGRSKEEIQQEFGFFLTALGYGAPPHGGIAIGLGRLCTILAGDSKLNLRDFIAFPKNSVGKDMMLAAPTPISPLQVKELQLESDCLTKT